MRSVGVSWLIDLKGIKDSSFHGKEQMRKILTEASEVGNLNVLNTGEHQFTQQLHNSRSLGGSTVFLLLSESHLSVHTWPEHDQIVVDLFSCGPIENAQKVVDYLVKAIPHETSHVRKYRRGDSI